MKLNIDITPQLEQETRKILKNSSAAHDYTKNCLVAQALLKHNDISDVCVFWFWKQQHVTSLSIDIIFNNQEYYCACCDNILVKNVILPFDRKLCVKMGTYELEFKRKM